MFSKQERKQYEKNCERYNIGTFTEEQRLKAIERFKKELALNDYRIYGRTNYHNSLDDIHGKKIHLMYAGYTNSLDRKFMRLYSINPEYMVSLGYNNLHYVKKPYSYQGYFYSSVIGSDRVFEVIQSLNYWLFPNEPYKLKDY